MGLIKSIEQKEPRKFKLQSEQKCTYFIITDDNGGKFLQIEAYGSEKRENPDVPSQNLRFTEDAVRQLKLIIEQNFE